MIIKYDISVVSNEDKYAYCYRLLELLRLEYNNKGTDYRKKIITKSEWLGYRKYHKSRRSIVISEIINIRFVLENDSTKTIGIDDIDSQSLTISFKLSTDESKYGECYRLIKLIREAKILNKSQYDLDSINEDKFKSNEDDLILQDDIIISKLLQYRNNIQNNTNSKASLNDIQV